MISPLKFAVLVLATTKLKSLPSSRAHLNIFCRASLNRVKAAEGAKVMECPDDYAMADDFDSAMAGASKGFVNVLLLLPILLLHHLYYY